MVGNWGTMRMDMRDHEYGHGGLGNHEYGHGGLGEP